VTLLRVDHTAIVVRDLDEALARYRRIFGLEAFERTAAPDQGVEVAFLRLGNTQLELIQPLDSTSGVARFLERRGEGLHHIGVLVEDLRSELRQLQDQGVELLDGEPRRGVHGHIAFIHPRGMGGVLVELVEHSVDELQA